MDNKNTLFFYLEQSYINSYKHCLIKSFLLILQHNIFRIRQ